MTKYDNRYDNRDNFGNKYRKYYDNAAARSGSDVTIFDPITTPWSCLGLAEEYQATMATVLRPRHTMYLRVVI